MNNLILTKVRYWRTEENGNQKKITEQYLVEAPTFGKAEERAVEKLAPYANDGVEVLQLKMASYGEVLIQSNIEEPRLFEVKVAIVTIDEKSGKEKRTKVKCLVVEKDMSEAADRVVEVFQKWTSDYEITDIRETSIVDIFVNIP